MAYTEITPEKVNRDFSIQYFPKADKKHSRFISAQMFIQILGDELAFRKLHSIYDKGEDSYELKFRRGIRFVFTGR